MSEEFTHQITPCHCNTVRNHTYRSCGKAFCVSSLNLITLSYTRLMLFDKGLDCTNTVLLFVLLVHVFQILFQLALDALERIVDGFDVTAKVIGDLLIALSVQIGRQHLLLKP